MRFPNETATLALDYVINRPIVAGIRVTPPVLMHGYPVRIDALVIAPPGQDASINSVDVCGLRDDLIVSVSAEDCFNEPELVTHIGDAVPTTWEPPDLSAVVCPYVPYGPYGYDTGGGAPPPDSGADTASDTGDTDGPSWNAGACASNVPLMVRGEGTDGPFFGRVYTYLRIEPYTPDEYIPAPFSSVATAFTSTGTPQAGGEVDLELRVAQAVDDEGFRWWIDAGVLLGTGRTVTQAIDGDLRITRNTLRIPEDWHGPLRIFVVAESRDSDQVPYTADLMWETLTLDVP